MRLALWLGALALIAGCGGEQGAQPTRPVPTPEPAPVEPEPEPTPVPVSDPCAVVPEGNLRGVAASGLPLYQLYCATCHGPEGRGDGPAAPPDPKPADHTDAQYMATLTDRDLYCVIHRGGAAIGKSALMAPWGTVLNPEQLLDVLAYVRSLSGT